MVPLNIEVMKLRKIAVVTLTGDFMKPSSLGLRNAIIPLIEEGYRCFVIEFDVSQLDESGVGEFISTLTTITNLGGELAIIRNELLRNVMREVRLLCSFNYYATVDEAIEWLERNCTKREV
jgi:anti-anti-sigma regulatory factor